MKRWNATAMLPVLQEETQQQATDSQAAATQAAAASAQSPMLGDKLDAGSEDVF